MPQHTIAGGTLSVPQLRRVQLFSLCLRLYCVSTVVVPITLASINAEGQQPIPPEANALIQQAQQAIQNGQCDLAASRIRAVSRYFKRGYAEPLDTDFMSLILQNQHCEVIRNVARQRREPLSPAEPVTSLTAPSRAPQTMRPPDAIPKDNPEDTYFCFGADGVTEAIATNSRKKTIRIDIRSGSGLFRCKFTYTDGFTGPVTSPATCNVPIFANLMSGITGQQLVRIGSRGVSFGGSSTNPLAGGGGTAYLDIRRGTLRGVDGAMYRCRRTH